jgi:hypothetical protein
MLMMSSLYKTMSFFRPPPRRLDRSAGVTVRRRRSVRRRRPERTGRRPGGTGRRPGGTGRRPGETEPAGPPRAVPPASEKRSCVSRDFLPSSDMFYEKRPLGTRHPAPLPPPSSPDPPSPPPRFVLFFGVS